MDGQLEAHIALDDWYIALQRIRDVVAAAETYSPTAFRESVKPLWQDTREAQTRLLSALGTLERGTAKERKPVEIEDDESHVIGRQETLINGKRPARIFVLGENVRMALEDSESGHAQREVQLCLSCKSIVEKCPRCGADARPSPAHVGSDTWTEFHCSSCNFRFPDNGKNGLCPKCLNPARRK